MKSSLCVVVVAAGSLLSSGAHGQNWFGAYNPQLGTLPTAQGWSLQETGVQPPPVVVGGELLQGPTTVSGAQYWDRTDIRSSFDTVAGLAVEVRLRVISSTYGPGGFPNTWRTGWGIWLGDNAGRVLTLGISDTGIRISTSGQAENSASSPFIPLDTTSAFRAYLLQVDSNGVRLSVDGVPTASLPLGATGQSAGNPLNYFYFGDGTSSGASQTILQGIKWGTVATSTPACYANCDGSTGSPILTPADFVCFLNRYRAGCP